MTVHQNDDYFIQSLKNNDERGVLAIYRNFFPKISKYIMANSGTEEDAREIMQRGLLLIATKVKTDNLTISSSFEGYLFITCRNLWLREAKYKASRVTNEQVSTLISTEQEVAHAAYEQDRWDLFNEKLQALSENCRKILALYFKKVAYREIATQLNYSSENVVKQRIFKCKASIRNAVQSDSRYTELKD